MRDVCVIGGGAAGLSAAVFLKDKDYDVALFEKSVELGGHCDTTYFSNPGGKDWLDLGVYLFPDTAYDNASGIGSWTFSSSAFVNRFSNGNLLYNIGSTQIPNYAFDFTHNITIGLLPPTPPTNDFLVAYGTLIGFLAANPWLETADIPDPIPSEFLLPFSQFIANHNLSALGSLFFGQIFYGGMGDFTQLNTLYALQNLNRGILQLFADPASGFTMRGGCSSIVNGIASFLGASNIFTNTTITNIDRSKLGYVLITSKVNGVPTNTRCRKIFMAYPQTLDSLSPLDLTFEETQIFSHVQTRNYFTMKLQVDGPIAQNSRFQIVNYDALGGVPPSPNMLLIYRDNTVGPANCYAYTTNSSTTNNEMLAIVNQYLSLIPTSMLTTKNVVSIEKHTFQPHFDDTYLQRPISPYRKLEYLQGKHKTYWGGALFSFAETVVIWQKTYDLINQYF